MNILLLTQSVFCNGEQCFNLTIISHLRPDATHRSSNYLQFLPYHQTERPRSQVAIALSLSKVYWIIVPAPEDDTWLELLHFHWTWPITFWFVSFPLLFQLILTNVAAPSQVEILFWWYHLPALPASTPQIIWCWCQRPPWWFQGLRYDDYHQGIKGGYKLWAVRFFPLLLSHFFLDIFDWWIMLFLLLEPTALIHMSVLLRQETMKAHIFCFVLFLLPQWGFHCCGRQ